MNDTRTAITAQLANAVSLQDTLNRKVHEQWYMQKFPFHRALWTEAGEAMGYLGWEWWKASAPLSEETQDQLLLEMVDMLHFGISMRLQRAYQPNPDISVYRTDVADVQQQVVATMYADVLVSDTEQGRGINPSTIDGLERIVASATVTKTFDAAALFVIARYAGVSPSGLLDLYIGKNVLNRFRQDHGYKTGQYVKNWRTGEDQPAKVEDNQVLAPLVREVRSDMGDEYTPESFGDALYARLEAYYADVLAFAEDNTPEPIQ